MDIHQRRVGFRFDSVRTILGLSLFEFSRLLNRSHYTLAAIERSIRYPTDDLIEATIALAAKHDMILSYAWLHGEVQAAAPTSVEVYLQEKIESEGYIESCLVPVDDREHRKEFGHRLAFLLKNMALTPLQFAKWAEVSTDTVHKWLGGISLPKRDTMRFMIQKIKRERISVSLAWLCAGSGVLVPFQYIAPPRSEQKDDGIVQITIESSQFEPTISKNTKISAYAYPASLFMTNWIGFYLYCHEGEWMPVQLESTTQLDVFYVMSLHNKLADRIFLKNVTCAMIYPIIYSEKAYYVRLKKNPYNLVTA
jgi:DNA-binding transcriptional regulator YiaG